MALLWLQLHAGFVRTQLPPHITQSPTTAFNEVSYFGFFASSSFLKLWWSRGKRFRLAMQGFNPAADYRWSEAPVYPRVLGTGLVLPSYSAGKTMLHKFPPTIAMPSKFSPPVRSAAARPCFVLCSQRSLCQARQKKSFIHLVMGVTEKGVRG